MHFHNDSFNALRLLGCFLVRSIIHSTLHLVTNIKHFYKDFAKTLIFFGRCSSINIFIHYIAHDFCIGFFFSISMHMVEFICVCVCVLSSFRTLCHLHYSLRFFCSPALAMKNKNQNAQKHSNRWLV